ncbi:sodium-coupled monocarboxylate transporter 2-like isoform X3 [Varroa destructor]|uniref:Uncharacterized protein n=1 Tax=Varroa destructor TaxID=109461 RepID=A0A7M7MC99_VARDE|nr:sodium-coupled monocarboxylate transporter 2-like isoform X3 [Varroa destructor]
MVKVRSTTIRGTVSTIIKTAARMVATTRVMDDIPMIPNDAVSLLTKEKLLERFTPYDYTIVVLMLVCSGAIGLYCAFAEGLQKTTRQLLSANGRLSPTFVSLSLTASFISATFVLGNAAEVYQNSTMIFVTIGSYVFMLATTASFFVPIFYELGVNTCYQYLELRFSRLVRMAAVVLYIIEMLIYMSVSLYAPALAISSITGIKLWTTVCAISIVCTLYTSVGGIKAVVYTNAFQLVVMLIAMIVIVISGYAHLGGFNRVWKIAERGKRIHFTDFRFDPTVRHTVWGLVIGAAISNMGSYATNNMMVLRYFTVSSLNAAKWAVWMNLPLLVAVLSLSCLSGLLMFARYHACDPIANKQVTSSDQLLPYFILDVLGATTGMSGLFVAGIFAASLSSISSAVNALCNVFYIDIVLICWPSISSETGAKVIVGLGAVFSLLAIILVVGTSSMGQVLPATVAINSSVGAPLFGLFFVGIFFPTVTTLGVYANSFNSEELRRKLSIGQLFNHSRDSLNCRESSIHISAVLFVDVEYIRFYTGGRVFTC